jgi:hypothetical protein
VLRHLANNTENRFTMLQAKLLDPLAELARGNDIEALRELTALTNLLSLSGTPTNI